MSIVKRVLVIIPAYNAGATIGGLIGQLQSERAVKDILVVNDGSTDNTAVIAQDSGTLVISHNQNLGKGAALRTGFEYGCANNFNAVISIDADLQHDPRELAKFLDAYVDDNTIIIGTRKFDRRMPHQRKLSNVLSSYVLSLFCGVRITDSQSGYRLIPTAILKNIKLTSSRFELEPELLLKALRKKYRLWEIPISTIYQENRRSSIQPFLDTFRFLKMLFKSLLW